MPFSNELLSNAARNIRVKSVESDFEYAEELIYNALAVMVNANPLIDPEQVEIYIHGSYANNLNIFFPSNLEIVVELKKTLEFDPDDALEQGYKIHGNYFVDLGLEFGVADFRAQLFAILEHQLGSKCYESEKTIVVLSHKHLKHNIEITPCFSFKYINEASDKIFPGVVLHDASVGGDIVTFPRLHESNGHSKDLATDDNFKPIVRMFKTLSMIGEREFDFPLTRGYFIQCLLFNVPNNLFMVRDGLLNQLIDDPGYALNQIFLKVINYLDNCNMENFMCQNTVWRLFGNAAEFWDIASAKTFVKNMQKMYNHFPESRTKLA